jgi:hypothetical protein
VIKLAGSVLYQDGRLEAFEGGALEFIEWERYAIANHMPTRPGEDGSGPGMTMTYYLAYAACTRGAETRPSFEAWLATLADLRDVEAITPDPTPPDRSAEQSASYPPPPASPPISSPRPIPSS